MLRFGVLILPERDWSAGQQAWRTAEALGFDHAWTYDHLTWRRAERQARFAEFVDLLDRLLRQRETRFTGRYYVANDARTIPGCRQTPRVPFALAATGPRSMKVVARHAQTWVAVDSRGAGAEQIELLRRACDACGRDVTSISRLVLLGHVERPLASVAEFERVVERYAQAGFTDLVVHWPRSEEPFAGSAEVLQQVAGVLDQWRSRSDGP